MVAGDIRWGSEKKSIGKLGLLQACFRIILGLFLTVTAHFPTHHMEIFVYTKKKCTMFFESWETKTWHGCSSWQHE